MFILLVLAILTVRYFPQLLPPVVEPWAIRWQGAADGLRARLGPAWLYLLLAAPVLTLALVLVLLSALGWSALGYLLSFAALLLCFGPAGLRHSIDVYLAALQRNDLQAAYHDAAAFNSDRSESSAETWDQLHGDTLRAISARYFDCYFPVIFWFVVLGVPGALFYRLVTLYATNASADDAPRLALMARVLEWLPLRLVGLALAVVGNFRPVMEQLKPSLVDYHSATPTVLVGYVRAAIHGREPPQGDDPAAEIGELEELPQLIDRVLVTWIAAIGLIAVL